MTKKTILNENWDLRKATLGILMKHGEEVVVLQKDEQIYNFCVTFVAWKLQLNPYELDKALRIVEVNLKAADDKLKIKKGSQDESKTKTRSGGK